MMSFFLSFIGSPIEVSYELKSYGIPSEYLPVDKATGRSIDTTYLCNHYLVERTNFEWQLMERRRTLSNIHHHDDPHGGDRNDTSTVVVVAATVKDVLLGRGRPFFGHPGNLYLFKLVGQYRSRYNDKTTTYGKKNEICDEIVELIHQSGGRFLKQRKKKTQANAMTNNDNDDDNDNVLTKFNTGGGGTTISGNNNSKKNTDTYIGWEVVDWDTARDKVSHAFRSKPPKAADTA